MQPDFWHERWRTAQIGFHQAAVDRHLQGLLADGLNCPPIAVYLSRCAARVSTCCGCAIKVIGCPAWNSRPSRWKRSAWSTAFLRGAARLSDFDVYEAERLTLFRGDFFKLTPALLGSVSAVYDRAALISWTPALRAVVRRASHGSDRAPAPKLC